MSDFRNANGSTGTLKEGVFAPFASQAEADGVMSSPFASLSESVQTSLKDAGITTVEQAVALGKDGLMKLPDIGEVTAKSILAL